MKLLTPIKAIRAKCLDCCCDQLSEVRQCPVEACSLWPYRLGKRPKYGADGADEKTHSYVADSDSHGHAGEVTP